MPAAVPFIAAAFSVTEGLAAIEAGSALLGGLMVAGGGLTAVGAATGNKDLTNLGAVLGFAGGVGSLIKKMGGTAAAGVGPATVTGNPTASAAADVGASTTVNTGGNVVQGADAAAQAANTAMDAGSALAESSSGGVLKDAMNGYSPGTAGSLSRDSLTAEGVGGYSSASPAQSALGNAGTTDAMQGGFGSGASDPASRMTATQLDLQNGTYDAPAGSTSPGSRWDQIMQFGKDTAGFIKNNPELTKLGGGLVGGAMDYYGKQQLAEDNMAREMAYKDWQRQRYSDSVRNLRVPGLVRTAPPTGGIIAGARG